MKQRLYLINKETGYVITCKDKNEYFTVIQFLHDDWKPCKIDLVEINEPLIENNKVRFSLKTWAYINNIHSYFENATCPVMEYGLNKVLHELKDGVRYTITELCGK